MALTAKSTRRIQIGKDTKELLSETLEFGKVGVRTMRKTAQLFELGADELLYQLTPTVGKRVVSLMEDFNSEFNSLENKHAKNNLIETYKLLIAEVPGISADQLKKQKTTLDAYKVS